MKKQITPKSILKTIAVTIIIMMSNVSIKAQGNVILSVNPDNCLAPTPNSGTYVPTGTLNSKTAYDNGSYLRIVWSGTQWEVQGDDPNISGVTWITGWHDTANTPKPPNYGWVADFGCFPITLTGDVSTMSTASVNNIVTSDYFFSDIYPNPASKEFIIKESNNELTKVSKEITVEVYDITGKMVLLEKHKVLSGETTIKTNIESFNKGTYFVKLLNNDNNVVYKQTVIKQ